jgi:hypothetical protein
MQLVPLISDHFMTRYDVYYVKYLNLQEHRRHSVVASHLMIQPRLPLIPSKRWRAASWSCTLVLARNASAHQIAQRVDRFIGNAVVHAGATALTAYQALLGHQGQVSGDVGCRVAAELGQFTDVAFAFTQVVEDAQARGFGQCLEVSGDLLQGFWREGFSSEYS